MNRTLLILCLFFAKFQIYKYIFYDNIINMPLIDLYVITINSKFLAIPNIACNKVTIQMVAHVHFQIQGLLNV